MSRTMESVDEFALGIVTSEPVQMFCKSQTEGASKEYNTAMLSLSLERQVQRSHNDYRFNANFLNIYAKNGISEIQFENLPYSDYESCIRYYEDMEIISNDRYTPMTWVDCVKLKDASGKSVNSLIWIRFLYDSVTMEKLVLWCAEEKSTQLETVMNKLSDDVALCFQTQLKIGIGAMISDLSQISVSAKYAQHCLDLEDTSAQSPQKNHLVVLAKKYV